MVFNTPAGIVVICDTPGCNNDSLPYTDDCASKEAALIVAQTQGWHVSEPTDDEPKSICTCPDCVQKRVEAQRNAMEKPRGLRLLDQCPDTLKFMKEVRKMQENPPRRLIPGHERARKDEGILG